MNTPQSLPVYSDEALAAFTTDQLLELLAHDEDRVPRNAIDECARRGDTFVAHLDRLLTDHDWENDATMGKWWRLLHAAMILGAIPTAAAGLLLASHMREMARHDQENLEGWLAGDWPALFQNKPASVLPAVRTLAEDRAFHWYVRTHAMQTAIAIEQRIGSDALEQALDRLAVAVSDPTDDTDYRAFCANALLDYARPRHRAQIEVIAKEQDKNRFGAIFRTEDVARAYATDGAQAQKQMRRDDPWEFYNPQTIAARQERWAKEDREEQEHVARDYGKEDGEDDYFTEPYVRDAPKVGRNDPCPCGSGKKYKKCCLNDNAVG